MRKRDILRLIFIELLIAGFVTAILISFSKEYLVKSISVAQSSISEPIMSFEETSEQQVDGKFIEEIETNDSTSMESSIVAEEVSEPEIPEIIYGPDTYYIKVNNQMNTVTIYTKDEEGNYTIPIKAMICSTGENTPKDCTYTLNGRRWPWKLLFGNVYGKYTTHINLDILFHSVPYLKEYNSGSLEYWEYDKLGTTASAGCVRLTVEDAKWIYDNCLKGSIVEFYSSDVPGELGKPSIEKISDNEECRNWDPTDIDENNPWNM